MRRLRDSWYPLTGSIVPLLFLWHTEYSTSSHSLRIPYPCAPVHMSHSASPSKDAGRLGPSHPLTPIVNQAKSSQVPGVGGDRGSLWPDWGGVTLCHSAQTHHRTESTLDGLAGTRDNSTRPLRIEALGRAARGQCPPWQSYRRIRRL